jgi:DNA-binding NarL/FixJ family response regulator
VGSLVRFLIADDHELVRRGMRSIIESRGNADVYEAQNGIEAVERIKREKFDLVILDVSMPICDGFAAAREIRKIDFSIPILFVSLNRTKLFVEVARRIGVNGYVIKSESSSTLMEAVDRVLGNESYFPSEDQQGRALRT